MIDTLTQVLSHILIVEINSRFTPSWRARYLIEGNIYILGISLITSYIFSFHIEVAYHNGHEWWGLILRHHASLWGMHTHYFSKHRYSCFLPKRELLKILLGGFRTQKQSADDLSSFMNTIPDLIGPEYSRDDFILHTMPAEIDLNYTHKQTHVRGTAWSMRFPAANGAVSQVSQLLYNITSYHYRAISIIGEGSHIDLVVYSTLVNLDFSSDIDTGQIESSRCWLAAIDDMVNSHWRGLASPAPPQVWYSAPHIAATL